MVVEDLDYKNCSWDPVKEAAVDAEMDGCNISTDLKNFTMLIAEILCSKDSSYLGISMDNQYSSCEQSI